MKVNLPIPKSKKLWVTIVTLALPVLNSIFGWSIDVNVLLGMFGVSGAYNIGQGVADGFSDGKTSSSSNGNGTTE